MKKYSIYIAALVLLMCLGGCKEKKRSHEMIGGDAEMHPRRFWLKDCRKNVKYFAINGIVIREGKDDYVTERLFAGDFRV
ncbi:MAG: hypothetical protein IKX10_04020 [Lachnospiraceae bacterium]|nr:hypothetical protein [Lachnospiraceae bacterium]